MKTSLILLAFAISFSAQAKQRVLDCNISTGAHQQVMVEENGKSLELHELDNTGRMHKRFLPQKEFDAGKLSLNTDRYGGKSWLNKKSDGTWFYSYELGSLKMMEVAGCR